MIELSTIPARFRQIWSKPVDKLGRWHRAVRYGVELAVHGAKELHHDRATQMAAALTYHTLFSLLPTLVLAMVIMHTFVGAEQRNDFKKQVANWIIPEEVAEAGNLPGSEEARRARQEVATRIESVMEDLEKVNFSGVGVVGLLLFIYAATGLLAMIERSFNNIYGVVQSRPWYLRLPMYYTVITLGPVVLIAAQAIQSLLLAYISRGAWLNWLVGPAVILAPILLTWLLFFVMFTLLPNTKVGKRSSAIGSFVAAVLFIATQSLFGLYVQQTGKTSYYGALGVLPLFLFWLYVTWLLILFGVEIAHTLSAMSSGQFKHLESSRSADNFIDPAWVMPLMTSVAAAFRLGKTIHPQELSRSLNLPTRVVRQLIGVLEKQGLLHSIQERESQGYSLALPAEKIPLNKLIDAIESMMPQGSDLSDDRGWAMVQQLHQTHRTMLKDKTLADLV